MLGFAQAGQQSGPGNPLMQMLPFILIFFVFWLLVIRPQSKKAKAHQRMLSELQKNDQVVTNGGIIGRITGLKDSEVVLQVQDGVRLRVLRSAITGKYQGSEAPKTEPKS